MKKCYLVLLIFAYFNSYSQAHLYDSIQLTIAPNVDQENAFNRQIITTLKLFLESKDSSYTQNKFWLPSDFEKYITPYADLEGMEAGRLGKHFYQPSLMEIIETDRADKKIIKLAFIGHNEETHNNLIKAICNIVATRHDGRVVFSAYMDYISRNWHAFKDQEILYKIPAWRTVSKRDVARQRMEVNKLCIFLHTEPIALTFYSCASPKDLFELLGFDYHPNMYNDTSGGWNRDKNIVISANKSEYYMHELTHVYLRNLFPSVSAFFNEGFATYVGGSGKYDYGWQRDKLLKFLETNPAFAFAEHVEDPYERLYYEHETPVPYVIGALVCERTMRLYGKEKLIALLNSKKGVWDTLQTVGITKENINLELQREIRRPPTRVFTVTRGMEKISGAFLRLRTGQTLTKPSGV